MAPRNSKQTAKAAERREMKDIKTIQITIKASEFNLQRLAAYMLFCEHLEPVIEIGKELPLPWEDPNDPRFQKPPELLIDYEVVRRSIMKHLSAYLKIHGEERAKAVLESFGAPRLSAVPQDQLLALDAALEAALQAEPKRATE